jgi:nitroreductase
MTERLSKGVSMEMLEAMRARHSTRVYDGTPVDVDTVLRLVEAATLAPSAHNSQPWHFHVAMGDARHDVVETMALTTQYLQEYMDVLSKEDLDMAARFYEDLGKAPVVIAISVPASEDASQRAHDYISVGAAIQNFMLAAVDEGLGACSVSAPLWIVDRLVNVFSIPAEREIASLLIVGHPDETPTPRARRHDVVTFLAK